MVKSLKADLSNITLRANAQNVSPETLYGGKFTFFNSFVNSKLPVILSHQCSTTVSSETYPLYLYVELLLMMLL